MLTVEATATLVPATDLSDDELPDLIAAVIDYLDARVIDPSVSTVRTESGVRIEISVIVDTDARVTAAAGSGRWGGRGGRLRSGHVASSCC